jgi:hypothetical protein
MRLGASMIELVIAIVVMGIAVMSLPLILTQSQNSNAMALQQEAILATKTKLGYLLSYEWDANSYDALASVSRVLNTTASASADSDFNTTTTRRTGHVVADNRRRLRDDLAAPSTDGGAGWADAALEDIDDFDGKDENTTIASETMDYIFNLQLMPTVNYISDTASYVNQQDMNFTFDANTTFTNPTNIKMITVTTTGNNIKIVLRAFASNVGESGILKRAW